MTNAISGLRILPADIDLKPSGAGAEDTGFGETLRGAMDQVDQLQSDANAKTAALLNGSGMDIHSALIAVEEADLSFQLMMQVRNKIVSAYQEVMRMQV